MLSAAVPSVLDLTSPTLPRLKCRFDSDRPLHQINHLPALIPSAWDHMGPTAFPPAPESVQPTFDVPPPLLE